MSGDIRFTERQQQCLLYVGDDGRAFWNEEITVDIILH
jgi:hypothetical protein